MIRLSTEQQELVRQNMDLAHRLHGVFRCYLRRHHGDGDELFSILQLSLCRAAHRYNPALGNCKFSTYAITCMRNAAFGYFRHLKDSKRILSLVDHLVANDEAGPDDIALARDIWQEMERFLTGKQCQVMRMRMSGVSADELAEGYGVTRSSIDKMVNTSLRTMRERWAA